MRLGRILRAIVMFVGTCFRLVRRGMCASVIRVASPAVFVSAMFLACSSEPSEGGARFADLDASCGSASSPCGSSSDGGGGAELDAPAAVREEAGAQCDYRNTCEVASELQAIVADDGNDTKSHEGTTSEWVGVRAIESVSSAVAHAMKISATLEVPPGSNFDLYLYADTSEDRFGSLSTEVNCTKLATKSTLASDLAEAIELEWGETGFVANLDDESRNLRFEVRHVSGACEPGKRWKLTVNGNR